MNQDSNAILTLCSHISAGDGIFPLEPKEYSQLAATLYRAGKFPRDILGFTADDFKVYLNSSPEEIERIQRLLDRNASLSFCFIGIPEYGDRGDYKSGFLLSAKAQKEAFQRMPAHILLCR